MARSLLIFAFATLALAVFLQTANAADAGTSDMQPQPLHTDEIHHQTGSRANIVGLDANEKAGLTAGFTGTWFLIIMTILMLAKIHHRTSVLEETVASLKTAKAEEIAEP
mmetsp:Transcript_4952/g.9292  ORF Transcript_4952/g.9292 Transcript_4952/m.9292 type:complete len:110 (+) Transcript_4952:46-375(+)|eukprot:CAMPEP_0114244386 /NCGR_PEP_ID=MMETSP0058-20121206/11306_1 /TAXON_ID=36894 /ORGANISM="Pyramimonas parkeae, CCMP726" /LENGTH=109 /DNA_ID=CAMNT_0001357311 /DNA_START=61 /DNA_END=390 /DNA_ORIENTATION=-